MSGEVLTLLPRSVAREGYKFYFARVSECEDCRLRDACVGKLEDGRLYVVTRVLRPRSLLMCKLVSEEVIPVYVALSPIEVNVAASQRLPEGVTVTYEPQRCDKFSCKHRRTCFPRGVRPGDRLLVLEVLSQVSCPLGYPLLSVRAVPQLP